MKFEQHEGQLFRMLEEPVPLKEKDTNVLVQFITHGVIGEYVMEHWLDCGQENAPIFVDSVDSDGDVTVFIENGNEHHCCPFPMFEIIGYSVAEGSAEWALYQMMQGHDMHRPCMGADDWWEFRCDKLFHFDNYQLPRITTVDWFLINFSACKDWQIYKEPKPLLADAQVGDLCKHRNGDWSQIIDTNGTYIQGQPIRTTLKDTKGINRNFCLSGSHFTMQFGGEYDIIHTEPLAPEGSAEWAWQMLMLGNVVRHLNGKPIHLDGDYMRCGNIAVSHIKDFLSKAATDGWRIYEPEQPKPQEVIVPITIKGTVRKAYNDDGSIDDEQFQVLPNNCWDGTNMFISFDALDTHTRELVESLLEAMREES